MPDMSQSHGFEDIDWGSKFEGFDFGRQRTRRVRAEVPIVNRKEDPAQRRPERPEVMRRR